MGRTLPAPPLQLGRTALVPEPLVSINVYVPVAEDVSAPTYVLMTPAWLLQLFSLLSSKTSCTAESGSDSTASSSTAASVDLTSVWLLSELFALCGTKCSIWSSKTVCSSSVSCGLFSLVPAVYRLSFRVASKRSLSSDYGSATFESWLVESTLPCLSFISSLKLRWWK